MKLDDLVKWGIPARVIEQWRKRQGSLLLPAQSQAVRKGLLGSTSDEGESKTVTMIVSAPTSSGKSFCAEMAAVKALTSRKKAVVLFPLKALAEQKFAQFEATYRRLGLKVLIVSGDHPENDRKFVRGEYDIALCIYEKFNQYLTNSLDALSSIGLVAVDEIQTVADPQRGLVLENLLTKIKASVYKPSLVGLSAVIGDDNRSAGRLSEWLGATLVEERRRPVELKRGVASGGTFRYRSFNSGSEGSEPFASSDDSENSFKAFVGQLKAGTGSTLVFLKSRMETVEFAVKLAASVNWTEASSAIEALKDEEPSFLIRSLRQCLSRGVAFHNSDLSLYQRGVVEQAFVNKEIKAILSTTTLAMGVNLSADNVYLETVKYAGGKYNGQPVLVPVSRSEFDNMTGRAGRLESNAASDQVGRAVIMARSEFDSEILWDNYIADDEPEELRSAMTAGSLSGWLLEMAACGLLKRRDDFSHLFKQTLYVHSGGSFSGESGEPGEIEAAFEKLVQADLIDLSEADGTITITSLGRAVAKTGLSVAEAEHFNCRLEQSFPESQSGWLALVLSSPDWVFPPSLVNRYELRQNRPQQMLFKDYNYSINELAPLLKESDYRKPLDYKKAASLKTLFLLDEYRALTPLQTLEEKFQIHLGQIISLGERAAHLVVSIGELLVAEDNQSGFRPELSELAFSLRHGLPAEMRSMHRLFGSILNRSDLSILYKAGLVHPEELSGLSEGQLSSLVASKAKQLKINKITNKFKEEVQMEPRITTTQNHSSGMIAASFIEPETIEIDGSYERERYLVKINGFPVRLTGKSFKYFIKLAWSRLNGESGWLYKDDIEHGFNQARYLYRMKGEISQGLNSNWPIFENNRLGYYRLNADPSKIKVNLDNLRNHPDFEVRSLVKSNLMTDANQPGRVN